MDHHQVDSSGLIERYVFGHLTPQQMEQLEVHLFECPECATELHETAMFLINARVVLREPLPEAVGQVRGHSPAPDAFGVLLQRFRAAFLTGAPALAALVFLGLYTHEALVVNPALRREIAESAQTEGYFHLTSETRGENENLISLPRSSKKITVAFDVRSSPGPLTVTLASSGKTVFSRPGLRSPPRGQEMHVELAVQDLNSGEYSLEVREDTNPAGEPLASALFQLQFK